MDQIRRPYFGRRLRELRESFVRRLSSGGAEVPYVRATVSASALIDCMKREQGFSISSAAYNEIENGLNMPRDTTGFLDAVAACLRLNEDEKRDLSKRLAYDLVWARLRDRTDEVIPPSPHWLRPAQ
jgi:hypothetical protein